MLSCCTLQKFGLTKPDILQILNLRPRYPVELALIGSQKDVSPAILPGHQLLPSRVLLHLRHDVMHLGYPMPSWPCVNFLQAAKSTVHSVAAAAAKTRQRCVQGLQ